jgi:hypothetical protein
MGVTSSTNPYMPAVLQSQMNYITPFGNTIFVDGTNGADTNNGASWGNAFATIQAAVTASSAGDTIVIAAKKITAGSTDPTDYAETVIIPATKSSLSLIGVSRGRTQGGLPQIKPGSGSTALLTIRASGCYIKNIGFNGVKSADGTQLLIGILLDDDGSTKSAIGTTIEGCHFKNCAGSNVLSSVTGGAITWSANGGAWQALIKGNRFYKNVCDVSLMGTSVSVPQDVVIEDNVFSGPASVVDCNLFLKGGGSGMNGVTIRSNTFQQLPALSSGVNARYIIATGCVGMLVGNTFGCQTNGTGGTRMTFKVGGTAAEIPTTMHVAGNFGQTIHASESGEVSIV